MYKVQTVAAPEPATATLPQLLHLLSGVHLVKAIHVAIRLEIPDHLQARSPQSLDELAQATATQPDMLLRLLRALGALDLVEEVQECHFAMTALTPFLCTGQPGSIRDLVLWMFSDWNWSALGELEYSIRSGQPAFEHVHGTDVWNWLATHPEPQAIFNRTLDTYAVFDRQIMEAYDFSQIHVLADIGGGHGHLLREVLRGYPDLRGLLFDLEPVIAEAREHLANEQLQERCQTLVGSFFEQIPAGADAYLFKFVLHNWDDEACRHILRQCRAAMTAGNRLLIIEHVPQPGKWSREIACTDLVMMSLLGGRVRLEQEFRELLTTEGFALSRVIPISHTHTILEGTAI